MALEAFGVESVTVTITIQDCGHDDNYKHYRSVSLTLHHLAPQLSRHFFSGTRQSMALKAAGSLQKATSGRNMVESITRMRNLFMKCSGLRTRLWGRAQNGRSPKEAPKTAIQEAFFEPCCVQQSLHQRTLPSLSRTTTSKHSSIEMNDASKQLDLSKEVK